eukprot:SAG11_NODE_3667_length_2299_cov_1.828182_1_plen_154_part_00
MGRAAGGFDAVLFDFGLSSDQLAAAERGFSFQLDGPLDMRMDGSADPNPTAADFLETADEAELVHAVRDLGEEPNWRPVVRAILRARGGGKLQRSSSFAALVAEAAGGGRRARRGGRRRERTHPATRTFQVMMFLKCPTVMNSFELCMLIGNL